MKITPEKILRLNLHEVFVFGSNYSGRHGKGAARDAYKRFGARWGQGLGMMGQTYGIPTKDDRLRTLPLDAIKLHVEHFIAFARQCPRRQFLVTPVGCGLAGYSPKDIAPLFGRDLPDNVSLPQSFCDALEAEAGPA